jgi:hypothetical protein
MIELYGLTYFKNKTMTYYNVFLMPVTEEETSLAVTYVVKCILYGNLPYTEIMDQSCDHLGYYISIDFLAMCLVDKIALDDLISLYRNHPTRDDLNLCHYSGYNSLVLNTEYMVNYSHLLSKEAKLQVIEMLRERSAEVVSDSVPYTITIFGYNLVTLLGYGVCMGLGGFLIYKTYKYLTTPKTDPESMLKSEPISVEAPTTEGMLNPEPMSVDPILIKLEPISVDTEPFEAFYIAVQILIGIICTILLGFLCFYRMYYSYYKHFKD